MYSVRRWRWLFVSLLTILVVACKPFTSFTVSPNPVVAGQAATFDASDTSVDPTIRNNAVVSYAWDFGDQSTGTGKIATHTYAAAGTYTVKLTVRDKAGQIGSSVQSVVVQPQPPTETGTLRVQVRDQQGVALPHASVTLAGTTSVSDEGGYATLADIPVGKDEVVVAALEGYITQVLQVEVLPGKEGAELTLVLAKISDQKELASLSAAQTISTNAGDTSIDLPDQALVTADGQPAAGSGRVEITRWELTGSNRTALLGQGRAQTAGGASVFLVPEIVLTVSFYNPQNQHLQLATGKTATITADLLKETVQRLELTQGSTLPLWHFDESTGTWQEEGVGNVVTSSTAPSGLAVQATVSHFSTWAFGGSGATAAIHVTCVDEANLPLPCLVAMEAHYLNADGTSVGADTYTMNFAVSTPSSPNSGDFWLWYPSSTTQAIIHWQATPANIPFGGETLSADMITGLTDEVTLVVKGPTFTNLATCVLADGSPTACYADRTMTSVDGLTYGDSQTIPATGKMVDNYYRNITPLVQWQARSDEVYGPIGSRYVMTGTATSNGSGPVTITLDTPTPYVPAPDIEDQ